MLTRDMTHWRFKLFPFQRKCWYDISTTRPWVSHLSFLMNLIKLINLMNWMDTQTHVNPMAMASKGSVWNVSVVKLTSPVWPQSVGQRPSIHALIASELHNCIIGVRQHCQILFIWFVETGFDYWSTFSTKTTNKNERKRKEREDF